MGLQLVDIYKEYTNGDLVTPVLHGISMTVEDGEFVALIGPSGPGKSTTMNIIGCLDRPTSGKYYLDGQDVGRLNDSALAGIRNRYIGFVFQSFNLLSQYTALENVELPALYARTARKIARQKAKDLLSSLGMNERMNYYPSQLSGGQKQRVAIARALINQPRLLLADEPTGNLDSATGREVLEIFRNLNKEGHTIMVITHDLSIARHSSRVISIFDGRLEEKTI